MPYSQMRIKIILTWFTQCSCTLDYWVTKSTPNLSMELGGDITTT